MIQLYESLNMLLFH